MRALGFEPKKEEIKKMISDIDKGTRSKKKTPTSIDRRLTMDCGIHLLTTVVVNDYNVNVCCAGLLRS
jgi:hypothetical protein